MTDPRTWGIYRARDGCRRDEVQDMAMARFTWADADEALDAYDATRRQMASDLEDRDLTFARSQGTISMDAGITGDTCPECGHQFRPVDHVTHVEGTGWVHRRCIVQETHEVTLR